MNNPSTGSSAPAQNLSWMNTSLFPHERADLLLAQMTLDEKIEMVHGELPAPYGFYNAPIPRPGIPALTMADGPAGIRVAREGVNEGKATALPAPLGLAATWDLTAALFAVRPDRNYFSRSSFGEISASADGRTRFDVKASGRHRYLKMDQLQRARTLECMIQLASQPPRFVLK